MMGSAQETRPIVLHNGRVALALHTLQGSEGLPLLLLHELGGSAADWRSRALTWSGPVLALDLSGHGYSGRVRGGGYYPELWAADADIALASLGRAVVLGAGIGAYAALLHAGARPEQAHAAVLCSGAGLRGGGDAPDFSQPRLADLAALPPARELQPDCTADASAVEAPAFYVRPPAYAARFAAAARGVVLVEDGSERPPWWNAVAAVSGVVRCDAVHEALPRALAIARSP
jgi:pimeloyl-ACP methyl ester carboxylesterase